ncbi:MAG: hypothetical protein ACI4V0_06155 [Lachnospiraceae bacterium]
MKRAEKDSAENKQFLSMVFMSILAGIFSGLYLYTAKYKGRILEESIILYVLGQLMVYYVTVLLFLCSLIYGIKSYRKTKKLIYGIPCIGILLTMLLAQFFFAEINRDQMNYSVYLNKRKEIIEKIETGSWTANDAGKIELPADYQKEARKGLGHVYLVHTGKGNGIYFMASPGMEGSSGYVYLTDKIPETNSYSTGQITLLREYDSQWYSCAIVD